MQPLLALLLATASAAPAPAPCPAPAGLEAWTTAATVAGGTITLSAPVSLALSASPTADQPAAHAGAARLMIAIAGTYRVAIDQRAWIDVIAHGRPLASVTHQRGPDCGSIVKIVDFQLAPGTYTLAISRAAGSTVRVLLGRAAVNS